MRTLIWDGLILRKITSGILLLRLIHKFYSVKPLWACYKNIGYARFSIYGVYRKSWWEILD